ncbi:14868_t:CDS:2, partial [Racocetra fulgida]
GPLENYEFIIGDEEMNFGWTKMQIIDFLKQQKCSIDNPVKISDVEKEPPVNSKETEVVRKAFDIDFKDPSDLLKRFQDFINECSYNYRKTGNYYAPYTTLIQASGIGKSKLLKKNAEDISTIYCCLRDHNSSGYPPRSYIADALLSRFQNENDALSTYLAYFCACAQKLQEFNGSCKEWFDEHTRENLQEAFWKDVENRMTDIKSKLKNKPTDDEKVV